MLHTVGLGTQSLSQLKSGSLKRASQQGSTGCNWDALYLTGLRSVGGGGGVMGKWMFLFCLALAHGCLGALGSTEHVTLPTSVRKELLVPGLRCPFAAVLKEKPHTYRWQERLRRSWFFWGGQPVLQLLTTRREGASTPVLGPLYSALDKGSPRSHCQCMSLDTHCSIASFFCCGIGLLRRALQRQQSLRLSLLSVARRARRRHWRS